MKHVLFKLNQVKMKQLFTIAAALIITQLSYAQIPEYLPQEGLVAWYPFFNNADDLSGNQLNANVNGAVFTSDRNGELNQAMFFDGVDDFLSVAHNELLELSTDNAMSVAYWVKLESLPPGSNLDIIFSKQSGSGNSQTGWNINQNSSITQSLTVGNNGGLQGIGVGLLPLETWYHVTLTWDNTSRRAHLDGVLIDEQSVSSTIGANEVDLLIGKANWINSNAQHFNGTLDDIAIYSRALTQSEVEAIYNEELPPVCDPCLANYMAGDINCDGVVGTEDLLLLLVGFGSSIEP